MLLLLTIQIFSVNCIFPIDTGIVISSKSDKNLHISFGNNGAELKFMRSFPPKRGDPDIAKFYISKDGYNIIFKDKYMCKKENQINVSFCEGEIDNEKMIWNIFSVDSGIILKIKNKCLTAREPNSSNKGFPLVVKTCKDDDSQIFELREIPIFPIGWSNSQETDELEERNRNTAFIV